MRKRLLAALLCLCMTALAFASPKTAYAWNGAVREANPNADFGIHFIDAHGNVHYAVQDLLAKERTIDLSKINHHVAEASYIGDPNYIARKGVDVSEWTGPIDWNQVHAAGIDFCFIRIGYTGGRGGQYPDKRAMTNIAAAKAAGMDVGVYFFSLAVNEVEAIQEAQFVIQMLGGLPLELPVMYDPEYVLGTPTRNDGLSGAQFTANAIAFCNTIIQAGYQAGVYANMIFECTLYDMKLLENYHIWFADYEPVPQSPYAYEFWQYNGKGGRIPGIRGDRIDLNLQFIPTPQGYMEEIEKQALELTGLITMENGEIFDANYYAATYPEVVLKLGSASPRALYRHYLFYGCREEKYPSAQAVANAAAYKAQLEAQALEKALFELSLTSGHTVEELRESYQREQAAAAAAAAAGVPAQP